MSQQIDVNRELVKHETQDEEITDNFILTFIRTDRSESGTY